MNADHSQTAMRFLQIDQACREQLKALHPLIEREIDGIIEGFYHHVGGVPELRSLLGGRIDPIKRLQRQHWLRLFSGSFDEDYFEQARRIGEVHHRIGLEPSWYMGGYCFALNALTSLIARAHRFRPERAGRAIAAVTRAVFLDMDIALKVYSDAVLEEREQRSRRVEDLIARFDADVGQTLTGVTGALAGLRTTSEDLTDAARAGSTRATAVAATSEQASRNVQTVSSAADELARSIQDIAVQVAPSRRISEQAGDRAMQTNDTVASLVSMAQKIGAVVELISDIASQTNLLALNATIEAARAGDAGKGFAVVAAEVKSLANQTARATEEIATQIAAMQAVSGNAAEAIRSIAAIIAEMNEISNAVAGAVEQQEAATSEIARNVQEASSGTAEVSRSILEVNGAAERTGAAAGHVLSVSRELNGQVHGLEQAVQQFLDGVRAVSSR